MLKVGPPAFSPFNSSSTSSSDKVSSRLPTTPRHGDIPPDCTSVLAALREPSQRFPPQLCVLHNQINGNLSMLTVCRNGSCSKFALPLDGGKQPNYLLYETAATCPPGFSPGTPAQRRELQKLSSPRGWGLISTSVIEPLVDACERLPNCAVFTLLSYTHGCLIALRIASIPCCVPWK